MDYLIKRKKPVLELNKIMLLMVDETGGKIEERLNVLLLWCRYYIYQSFIQQDKLSFHHLEKFLKLRLNMLKVSSRIEGRSEEFQNRWGDWLE